jgi:hypothetical protein
MNPLSFGDCPTRFIVASFVQRPRIANALVELVTKLIIKYSMLSSAVIFYALVELLHGDEGQAEIANFAQDAMQRRLISELSRKHATSIVLVADRQAVKPGSPTSI